MSWRWLRYLEIRLGWGRGGEKTHQTAASTAKTAEGLRGQRKSPELAERRLPQTQQMGAEVGRGTSSQTPRCRARRLSLGKQCDSGHAGWMGLARSHVEMCPGEGDGCLGSWFFYFPEGTARVVCIPVPRRKVTCLLHLACKGRTWTFSFS